ncbi:MAG: hypothetical protein A2261_02275 [Candidatus Magasanikbacteria bacterium RIFOXYA2_FULL_44_8]|uniref:Glutaredoxin domain-containing protein n=1 Tax=Candidatus Magasanikbacteria bacterium RIFOXYA2_FULL_44_8 TaxID=1798696 RepID=A0A1F6NJ29_9BACT|nr:MAG: hypothetical protein A2261_02275 [Candidatus Magasanikbacteria bacterium RIFOXYA2_FULL_44_8]
MKNTERNILILIIIGIIVLFGGLILVKNYSQRKIADGRQIFFYGDGCPHCLNVEKFVADNKVEDKIKFEKLEVFNNQDNLTQMLRYTKKCGLTGDQGMGVPVYWDGAAAQCYSGDEPIINFLKTKI